MQDSKWSPSQESVPSYMALSNNSYPYRDSPSHAPPPPQPPADMAAESSMHGLMSMTQPGTPRPDTTSLPPTPLQGNKSPSSSSSGSNGGAARPTLPARPASFTSMTTFPSHPYNQFAGPIRKRRTESIFSFEMGPSFSSTKQLQELLSLDQSNGYQVQLHAKMDRGFFRADQDWACYRRNYFQVSGTFDVHGINYLLQGPEVPCLLRKSEQELYQVEFFSIGVSACVSNNADKKIELVQHTPKRDKGPQMVPKPQPVRAGGNLHLASVGSSHHIVTFERMQFKTATANNGKRRAAQQYYEIVIDLYANTSQGEEIRVATCHSAPLVVRGRSPGHYADSHTRYRHNMTAQQSHEEGVAVGMPPPPPPPPPQPGSAERLPPPPRYLSLPASPVSDLGPYSPYYGYPTAVGYQQAQQHPPAPPPPQQQQPPYASSSSDSYFQGRLDNENKTPTTAEMMAQNSYYSESPQSAFYSSRPPETDTKYFSTMRDQPPTSSSSSPFTYPYAGNQGPPQHQSLPPPPSAPPSTQQPQHPYEEYPYNSSAPSSSALHAHQH
ncbi:hypothetical protein BJV82DRAFT_586373 [Fennellomyces sp. T-0311]|nr:hypothetical protein BJV82DRAFT_586373 [Fennellomyces sp. T-0311]